MLLGCYLAVTFCGFDLGRGGSGGYLRGVQGHLDFVDHVPVERLRMLSRARETVGFVEAQGPPVVLLDPEDEVRSGWEAFDPDSQ